VPGGSLGTIRGQIRLDVANAIAGYAAVRAANARTMNSMNDARNRMRGFGLAAVGMGAAFLAGFGMAVNAAADFEKKLDYFGAVNNATAGEMEKVRQKALELGRTSQYSAGQIADAFVEMGKAGVSAKDITDGMAQAMVNLASAADIDLAQATNIVTSQIQAYGLAAKDAAHVTDVMAGAANASIVDVQDLGVSLKYVGGVAHSLGISFDDTVDALSLLGKAGIKGSTAGTSLRQIMVSLAGGTDKAKGVMEELGIITADGANKFFDASGKAKSLSEVSQILQDHTAGLTQKQRLMAFRTIFNNRALAAASILTKEGAKGFAEMNSEIGKTTAAEVAAKRMDNLSGDIKKLKGNIDTLLIEAGGPFQNFLRGIVQGLTKMIQFFARLPAGVQTAIMTFLLVAGIVLVVAGTISIFGAAIMGAIGSIKSLVGAFKAFWAIAKAVTIATRAMTVAALANPYVLLAIAVVALVVGLVLLYKKSEAFRNFINAIGRGMKAGFLATVEWFKTLPGFFANLWKDIQGWFKTGVDWVKQNWDLLLIIITGPIGLIVTIIRRFGDDIVNFMKKIPGMVTGFISDAWSGFLSFLANLPYYIGFIIGFILGSIVKFGAMIGIAAFQAGQAAWNGIVWFFTKMPQDIWNALVAAWNGLVVWGAQMVATALATGTSIFHSVVDWFAKLPGRIWDLMVMVKNNCVIAWNSIIAGAIAFGIAAYNGVIKFFRDLPGNIYSLLMTLKNKVASAGNQITSAAKNFGRNAYNGVKDYVQKLPATCANALSNAIGAFKKVIGQAFSAAKSFGKGLWDGFKSGLGIHSPSYIEHAMWAITDVTATETARLKKQVRGMQGLARTLQTVHDTAAKSGSGVPEWADRAAALLKGRNIALSPNDAQLGLNAVHSIEASGDASRGDLEAPQDARPIIVNNYNPVAERGSDSAARKLRTLASMGAFLWNPLLRPSR